MASGLSANNSEGASSFVGKYIDMGGNVSIKMEICCFREAVECIVCENKLLILYLHKNACDFSKHICSYISKVEVEQIIRDHFIFLGWDIDEEPFRNSLRDSMGEFPKMRPFIRYIEQKIPAVICINSCGLDVKVCSLLRELNGFDTFLSVLKALVKDQCRVTNTTETEESEISIDTYIKFQQMMCNGLENRDYDRFDPNQLKYLKDKISFAFFGPPNESSGYNKNQEEQTTEMYLKILEENNKYSEYRDQVIMSVVYNCLVPLEQKSSLKDFSPVPVFILRKCVPNDGRIPNADFKPCRIIIDHSGRVYNSWTDYLEENKFCECLMVYPEDGRYMKDDDGIVKLGESGSPACGIANKTLKAADVTGSFLGLTSAGVLVASAVSATTVGPILLAGAAVAGAAAGIYSVGRSIQTLIDRSHHKESMDVVSNAEVRSAVLGIAVGMVGLTGAGANVLLTRAANSGIAVGMAGRFAANSINIANIGITGLAVGNSTAEIAMRWWIDDETPSTLAVLQLSASIFFFGHAVYNFRTAGTIIEEAQSNAMKDFKSSLRSNRHRKTFEKLRLQTMRENAGNLQKGRSEVISTIRNIKNSRDDVFAFLTRSNKKFNQMGIKFSAKGGDVTLNGIPINPSEISTIARSDVGSFYADLSARPKGPVRAPSSTTRSFDFDLGHFMTPRSFLKSSNYVTTLIGCTVVEEKVMRLLKEMFEYFETQGIEIWNLFKKLEFDEYPEESIHLILSYIMREVEDIKKRLGVKYCDRNKLLYFVNKVCDELLQAFRSSTGSISKFITFCTEWIIMTDMQHEEREQQNEILARTKRNKKSTCSTCGGCYFEC